MYSWQLSVVGFALVFLASVVLLLVAYHSAKETLWKMQKALATQPYINRHFARTLETLGFTPYKGKWLTVYGEYMRGWSGISVFDEEGMEWKFQTRSPLQWFFMSRRVRRLLEKCDIKQLTRI